MTGGGILSSLDRRQVLIAAGVLPLLNALRISPGLAAPPSGAFDVHCHVFNATDLPISGFLRRVVFEDYGEQVAADALSVPSPIAALVATLVGFLRNGVITAEDELEQITASAMALGQSFDPFSPEAQRALEDALREVLAGDAAALSADAEQPVPQESIDALRAAIEAEIGTAPEAQVGAAAELMAPTASRLFIGSGMIGRTFRWAAWLRSPRLRLIERLAELYSGDGRVTFFTPALVDYEHWLGDRPRSDLASQVRVMEAAQKAAFQRFNVFVHSLAPFDPWRQAMDVAAGRSPTALDIARDAVEERGFIGVKLYPPMGFLPTANAGGGLTYPAAAAELEDFSEKIDAALDQLYAWAEAEGVPILSHAANSQGAGPGYSERANPSGWEAVLARYPDLRLNLAHFGDFDEASGTAPWENATGALLSRYPNVVTDLSYLSEALPSAPPHRREAIAGQIRAFLASFDANAERLVYGSDWIMLGREADHHRYFEDVQSLLGQAGVTPAQWSGIARENAIRFYGLRAGEAGRARLDGWYQRMQLDASALAQFD